MPYKILLTGSKGLLGRSITRLAAAYPEISLRLTARTSTTDGYSKHLFLPCDLSRPEDFALLLGSEKPDAIIHAAAMTQVDACEQDAAACHRANLHPIAPLITYAKASGAHIVFLSTDFVYDGATDRFYTETDAARPLSIYGTSKLKAEQQLTHALQSSVTILRTALVYGGMATGTRQNFLTWAEKALEQKQPMRVFTDQSRCPTWVDDLAQLCLKAAKQRQGGVFHACGKNYLSIWQAVLQIAEIAGLETNLIQPIATHALHAPAVRPPRTPLSIQKAQTVFGYAPCDYKEGIAKSLAK